MNGVELSSKVWSKTGLLQLWIIVVRNTASSQFSPAVISHPRDANVLDSVVAIAPAPLLPGEKEADYATGAERIVGALSPRDAIEEFLIRDVVDLTGKHFALGVSRRES